jgi:hypothetical protein
MITIELAMEAEATVQQWGMLGTQCFWTDRLQLKGYMGAAVVWLSKGEFQAYEFYLGMSIEVLDAELYALYEALHSTLQLLNAGHTFQQVAIFSDTQATLLHLCTNDEGPSQCISR